MTQGIEAAGSRAQVMDVWVRRGCTLIMAAVAAFISWTFYMAIGPTSLGAALAGDPATLVYRVNDTYVGTVMTKVMQVLVVTSYLAGVLALQNACTRYLFAQGREALLPFRLHMVVAATKDNRNADHAARSLRGQAARYGNTLNAGVTAWKSSGADLREYEGQGR
jgi:hypothetical protein